MNYILLDLEWDNFFSKTHSRFVNEIVQIGAVKLDSKFHITDECSIFVKSAISKKLSSRFKRLTGITNDEMLGGISFDEAIKKYKEFCGNNYITLTWSTSDLHTLCENYKLFSDNDYPDIIGKYVDLQAYVQNKLKKEGHEFSGQLALCDACDLMNIASQNFDMHTARDDSMLSALLLKRSYDRRDFSGYIVDTCESGYFERLSFKPYYLTDIKDSRITQKAIECKCPSCGHLTKKVSDFSYKNYAFTAKYFCPKCNLNFQVQFVFKMHYDSMTVKKRISYCEKIKIPPANK